MFWQKQDKSKIPFKTVVNERVLDEPNCLPSLNLLQKIVKNCENIVTYGVVLVPLQLNQTK